MEEKVGKDKQKDAVKRRSEMEVTGSATNVGEHELDASEPKKIKRTVQQEIALDELSNCEAILKSESLNMTAKMTTLSTFFDSLISHNINILLLKEDFNDWVKSATLIILKGIHVTSRELFTYLKSALRTAPTIFESICDQVLSVVLFLEKKDNILDSYNDFMKLLVNTFEKLRRFPKLIAKLLCCVRDYEFKQKSGVEKTCLDVSSRSLLLLPLGFVDCIGPVISLLPSGQITDLWKTLHHNLTEECVKKLPLQQIDDCVPTFLTIVTQIFVEFLKNIKLADAALPEATLEKVCEFMIQFRDECLKPLGCRALQKNGLEFSKPFLQLAYTWAELNGLLLHYNSKYKKVAPVPVVEQNSSSTNLTYLHPYLDVNQWNKLATRLQDTPNFVYMINLVAQKLKYITVLEKVSPSLLKVKNVEEDNEDNQLVREHVKNAANCLLMEQTKLSDPTMESMEICSLVAEYISPEETIQLSNNFVKKIAQRAQDLDGTYYDLINSAYNSQIHCGLMLESLVEVLRRLGKMKILEKEMKSTLKDILSLENRAVILKAAVCNMKENTIEDDQKEINISLLHLVNKIVERADCGVNLKTRKSNSCINEDEFSSDLICDMLKYLSELPIEDYPLHLKTIVFLCSASIMIGIVKKASKNLVDMVGHIFTKSGSATQGNVTLFAVKWTIIFKWFCGHIEFFSESVQKDVINTILRNIYISPKSVADFEEEFNIICESEMISSKGLIALLVLEFLTTELQHGAKTKLTHQLQSHTRKLTHFVVKSLQGSLNASGNYGQSNTYLVEASSYRSCWLVQISLKALSKCEIENSKEDLSQFKLSVSKKVLNALAFLSGDSKLESEADTHAIQLHAIKFLHCICKAKEEFKDDVPDDFVLQLWNVSIRHELCVNGDLSRCTDEKSIIPKHLLKDIYEAANKDEFEEISSSIVNMASQPDNQKISDTKTKVLIKMLEALVESELISEKKQTRWKILDECLHAFLVFSTCWDASEDCLMNIVLPYVAFQTKLLRRRRPMGNLASLATCLASTAMVPLNKIKNVDLYGKVFCSVSDLLNAFALHRMDVISFRTHIFLQCFQVLVESIFVRADQKNDLSDVEIFDVRHCAHSIERICQSMKLGRKEFSRVSPYFVAVLIKQFEQITVYPVVKNPLLSGCYKLLDLCDEHGVAQLNSMLTAGSREVFKPVYEMYKRFYRYKGRV